MSVQHRILLEEYEQDTKREEKLKDIAASLTRPRERTPVNRDPSCEPPTREDTSISSSTTLADDVDGVPEKYMRGDPDGCVRGSAARVELPAEELLRMRKGWLVRGQARHWFVLRGAALLYYRDPRAEDCGILDGVIDLSGVAAVCEAPAARPYGFLIKTWDNRQHILSAVRANLRDEWMSAIRRTAGLPEPPGEKLYSNEKSILALDRQDSVPTSDSTLLSPISPITPMTPRSMMFSSDEEYKTASEEGRRDSVDWGDSIAHLPPSPILSRNPISRVKDKVKSRNIQNSFSSTSPQSDETIASDAEEPECLQDRSLRELIEPSARQQIIKAAETGKPRKYDLIKPLKSPLGYILPPTPDKQAIENEDLRSRLKVAENDLNVAEKELLRLRQIKSECILKEKKIEEISSMLQKTEEELNRRTKDAENMEVIKKMYNQDKYLWERKLSETEAFLKDSTEQCELLNRQLVNGQETIKCLQAELSQLNEKLMKSSQENETLFLRIKDLETRCTSVPLSKGRARSVESLRELANIDLDQSIESMNKDQIIEEYEGLKSRFEKAIQEIRAMKKELKESHNLYDELELRHFSLQKDMSISETNNDSQISMMAARIQDLTQKLLSSDKQVRSLKHKLQKSEARDKRRSLSLKGRESFSIGKEVEEKLTELENKISTIETGKLPGGAPVIKSPSKPPSPTKEKSPSKEKDSDTKSLKRMSARLRRKSLDSATSSEPMKLLIRLSSLETKVGHALDTKKDFTTSCESLIQTGSDTLSTVDNADTINSQRHLMDRLQSLENVVICSRNRVNECLCQVSAIRAARNRRSPSPVLERKAFSLKSIERCLTDVSKTLQECTDKCVLPFESIYEGYSNDAVVNVVRQLEQQLRTKLIEINKKKCALLESGELTQRKNLEFLAEKLAYEAVLMGKINDAVSSVNGNEIVKRLIKTEVEETSQLIVSLQSKINGSQMAKKQTVFKTSMDYLAKILSRKINIVNNMSIEKSTTQSQNIYQIKELDVLKASQKELNATINQYKSEKLVDLTKALIMEALNFQSETGLPFDQRRANLENIRIQEAWCKARDVVNTELINSEISHVLMRCAQMYDSQIESEKRGMFTLVASQQNALERWFQVAHQRLTREMKEAISDISACYQECLSTIRMKSPSREDRTSLDSQSLLYQLADVIAHKALIDAKIYLCTGGYEAETKDEIIENNSLHCNSNMQDSNMWSKLMDSETVVESLDSDPTQEAEFVYLFQHFSNECRNLFAEEYSDNKDDLMKISDVLKDVELVVKHLHLQVGIDSADNKGKNKSSEAQNKTQIQGVLDLCESLKKSVEALSTHIPCQHCLQLQSAMNRLREEHEENMKALKAEQERVAEGRRTGELARARARAAEELLASMQQQHRVAQRLAQCSENEAQQLRREIADHDVECRDRRLQQEQEQAKLKEHAKNLEKMMKLQDAEYAQQLEALRAAYHKPPSASDPQAETIRQRYQKEIEQLRALCEKGLLAMENSHRRVIQEMEEKHKAEREQLRNDKEQALAEETQATLAALDAMRKAHENEVQKEVSKFKKEFALRIQQNTEPAQLHTKHQEEMEEIKQEILSLSEKYSVKCVESAALEERLSHLTQQLKEAQMQLEAKNKQLRAHVPEFGELSSLDAISLVGLRDNSSPHGQGMMTDDEGLAAQNAHLADRVGRLASVSQKAIKTEKAKSSDTGAGKVCGSQNKNSVCKDRKHKKPAVVASSELSEFLCAPPRCAVSLTRVSISPLAGIVAERKKRFEL